MNTLSDIRIGSWVQRKPGQKYHLVESVVTGDVITRCGRRLADPFAETSPYPPLTRAIGQPQLCRAGCQREPAK